MAAAAAAGFRLTPAAEITLPAGSLQAASAELGSTPKRRDRGISSKGTGSRSY